MGLRWTRFERVIGETNIMKKERLKEMAGIDSPLKEEDANTTLRGLQQNLRWITLFQLVQSEAISYSEFKQHMLWEKEKAENDIMDDMNGVCGGDL